MKEINIIGGGLAGSEAAIYIASKGIKVRLFEMRPFKLTEAHKTGNFAEIVCSNSLGSLNPENGRGLLKEEILSLGSVLLRTAFECKVPAGKALAVDRECFSKKITEIIESNPLIEVVREEVSEISEGITIVATGPLTSEKLLFYLKEKFGIKDLYFYDALSPVVVAESLNMDKLFFGGRYDQPADYLNAPMTKEEYLRFREALISAKRHLPHDFDKKFFEACLPVEEIAMRGEDALRFGPLRPKGFNKKYYAVVQLRKENKAGTLYELVGFQTALTYPEQKRVFRMIPGLENAEFVRFGSIHKNAYIKSSALLDKFLRLKKNPNVFFAGQISGVEGYVEAIGTGLFAAINAVRMARNEKPIEIPENTMLGSLIRFITENELETPQPMRANFGIIPAGFFDIPKSVRKKKFIETSRKSIEELKKAI
ncbi:MAG: methylenetetrahydrofolate--tRNA-(uracil(54)-C(5))-methyltransferase (FADH(2)-oxidizing) TrmFO [Caldisericaceae bacterium]|nr:methylenetetrahydrofolate--tRNA-(uracil(54)-C(5))-methyltransferase (FADH(2)-oxidizing) TrmFO [Caldisericaceae bacterium]